MPLLSSNAGGSFIQFTTCSNPCRWLPGNIDAYLSNPASSSNIAGRTGNCFCFLTYFGLDDSWKAQVSGAGDTCVFADNALQWFGLPQSVGTVLLQASRIRYSYSALHEDWNLQILAAVKGNDV